MEVLNNIIVVVSGMFEPVKDFIRDFIIINMFRRFPANIYIYYN